MLKVNVLMVCLIFEATKVDSDLKEYFGVEGEAVCMEFNDNITSKQTVNVLNKNDKQVFFWTVKNGVPSLNAASIYKKRITLNGTSVDKVRFCMFNLTEDDAGVYYWKEVEPEKYYNITLQVLYGPKDIRFLPDNDTYILEQNMHLLNIECQANCKPKCKYYWLKNNTVVTTENILTLNGSDKENNGLYQCKAENSNTSTWEMSKDIAVQLLYGAAIIPFQQDILTIRDGDVVDIECRVDSFPISNVTWTYISEDQKHVLVNTTPTLILPNCFCIDSGLYVCSAYNGYGITDKRNITIDVLCAPRFQENMNRLLTRTEYSTIGDILYFNVTILSNPVPFLNKSALNIKHDINRISKVLYMLDITISIFGDSDFKEYSLDVENSIGIATLLIDVKSSSVSGFYLEAVSITIAIVLIVVGLVSIWKLKSSIILSHCQRRGTQKSRNFQKYRYNKSGDYKDNMLYVPTDPNFVKIIEDKSTEQRMRNANAEAEKIIEMHCCDVEEDDQKAMGSIADSFTSNEQHNEDICENIGIPLSCIIFHDKKSLKDTSMSLPRLSSERINNRKPMPKPRDSRNKQQHSKPYRYVEYSMRNESEFKQDSTESLKSKYNVTHDKDKTSLQNLYSIRLNMEETQNGFQGCEKRKPNSCFIKYSRGFTLKHTESHIFNYDLDNEQARHDTGERGSFSDVVSDDNDNESYDTCDEE